MLSSTVWKAYTPQRLSEPAHVVDVELSAADQLPIKSSYHIARLLVRVHARPVGYVDMAVDPAAPLTRDQILAALDSDTVERATRHVLDDLGAAGQAVGHQQPDLAALLDQAADASVPCQHAGSLVGPSVTVAICTRDRAQTIGATLDSLSTQTYRNFEVMVVDNAPPSDTTERLVRSSYPHVRYIREPRRGLDHARNRAINEARGSLLAYIDDDAVADRHWVQALVAAFATPDVMCVTGMVAPARLDTAGQELFERFGYSKGFYRLAFHLADPPPLPGFPYKGYLGTGCNSAFRLAVFDHVGLFDPRLDMGTPVPGGGDHDMFARIIRAGHTLVYDPGPVVFHTHLADLNVVVARLGQYQESFIAFIAKSILSDREYMLVLLRHMLFWYMRRTVRGLAAVVKKHDRPFRLVLSEAIGAWRGPISLYRSHRQNRATLRQSVADVGAPSLVAPSESSNKS